MFHNWKMTRATEISAWIMVLSLIWIPIGILFGIFLPSFWNSVVLIGCFLLALILTFCNMGKGIKLELYGSLLSSQKADRNFFLLPGNESRSELEKIFCSAAEGLGLKENPVRKSQRFGQTDAPLFVGIGTKHTLRYDLLQQQVLIYSVEHLDTETYQKLLSDALMQIRAEDEELGKKRERKILAKKKTVADAVTAIFLCDGIDSDVIPLLKKTEELTYGTCFPVAVDALTHRVYFDGSGAVMGLSEPSKTLIAKIVFGGKIPRQDGEYTETYLKLYRESESLTYFDYLRREKEEKQQYDTRVNELLCKLGEGEFAFFDGELFYKGAGKLYSLFLFPEDEEETPVGEEKEPGRALTVNRYFLASTDTKKGMTKEEGDLIFPLCVQYLKERGYHVTIETGE